MRRIVAGVTKSWLCCKRYDAGGVAGDLKAILDSLAGRLDLRRIRDLARWRRSQVAI